jgi:uncharacterized membrane protein
MRRTLFYGWVVVAVTAVVLLVTAGVRAAPGGFLLDMGRKPGWSTGALSFAIATGLLTYGLSGPISGIVVFTAVAAFVAGLVRENVDHYGAAFVAAGWIAIVAGFAALAIRRRIPVGDPVPVGAT